MIDLRMAQNKTGQCTTLKKYKSFAGTVKSIEISESTAFAPTARTYIATCGLDRFMRVHELESGQLISKVYVKSRSNCLLFSRHDPIAKSKSAGRNELEQEEDQESIVNSEDLGTDELWSDMETIVEEHPGLKKDKSKRLNDFSSNSESDGDEEIDENEEDQEKDDEQTEFKKPK